MGNPIASILPFFGVAAVFGLTTCVLYLLNRADKQGVIGSQLYNQDGTLPTHDPASPPYRPGTPPPYTKEFKISTEGEDPPPEVAIAAVEQTHAVVIEMRELQ
ncbi:hypothetical protein HDU97_004098 [Phlyctochytrium planicorne]|nr:hypothetical protein HDU97_004098 [Phlyctochytrium planicorne]